MNFKLEEYKRTLRPGQTLLYFDHNFPRVRHIYDVQEIITSDLPYGTQVKYRKKLNRSNLPKVLYKVWFCDYRDYDKPYGSPVIIMPTNTFGQWWGGSIYYWDSSSAWDAHTSLRSTLMHLKIERALSDIAYANKMIMTMETQRHFKSKTPLNI